MRTYTREVKHPGKQSRYNKWGKRIGKVLDEHTCHGCGRRLPRGSWMMIWQVWDSGRRYRVRLCSECQEVVCGCERWKPSYDLWGLMVRGECRECDEYPFCERAQYLRDTKPGEYCFTDLDGIERKDHGVHAE